MSQNGTGKQTMLFKTTANCLLNDIWCYVVIGCFDWKIGVFQQTVVRSLLYPSARFFIKFVNNCLFNNSYNHLWLSKSNQTTDFDSDIDGFINFRNAYQNNLLGILK